MSISSNKVNCVSCNVEFETRFKGKFPTCSKCLPKPESKTSPKVEQPPTITKNKVTCSSCKDEFESSFKGKNPTCNNCKLLYKDCPKPEPKVSPIVEQPPVITKNKVICSGCKNEFESSFKGKNPTCSNCKSPKVVTVNDSQKIDQEIAPNNSLPMATDKNITTCKDCKCTFETSFKGKNPRCPKCAFKGSVPATTSVTETPLIVEKEPTDSPTVSAKRKVTCVGCKNEFESAFKGKSPKCKNCK